MTWFEDLKADFYLNFIEDNRWRYLTSGLSNTLIITFFALLMGLVVCNLTLKPLCARIRPYDFL